MCPPLWLIPRVVANNNLCKSHFDLKDIGEEQYGSCWWQTWKKLCICLAWCHKETKSRMRMTDNNIICISIYVNRND